MKYDILIVGSGPGGYVAAIRAAQLGKKVALVERAEPGGVCLNWGCIPTKALLKSAQVYGYCKNAEHYGLEFAGEVRPDLEKIVARSRGVAETMSKGVRFLLNKNGIDLIPGFGRLTAPGRLDVDGTEYEADHIVLATGARPREMAFMPVDGEHVISSRQALTLDRLPESMIVVGSGAIGSEFAWFYAALGVKVTIIEYMPRMMPLEDEEVSKTMERAFRKLRATVLTSTTVKAVKVNAEGLCEVEIEGKKGAETLTAALHSETVVTGQKKATCTDNGYTGDILCAACGRQIQAGTVLPATGHHYGSDGKCTDCGALRTSAPNTGDSFDSVLWTLLLLGSGLMMSGLWIFFRKRTV